MSDRTRIFRAALGGAALALVMAGAASAAGTPEQKCQATKNKLVGKYMACRHNAEAKLATGGDVTKYQGSRSKCDQKFDDQWQKASLKVPTGCFDGITFGRSDVKGLMDRQADAFAVALGEYGNLVRYTFPASGQTTSYGPNSDGAVRAGGPLRFHFNFDGTITDDNTGLMWEIKTDDGSIHDKDNNYTWLTTGPPYTMNGTIVTTFLATLNAGSGFAGYTDWRIPNVKELQSIVDYETVYPAVYWVFDSHCTPGCDFSDCSCTGSNAYWSSTTFATLEDGAWYMSFDHGSAEGAPKEFPLNVRAVRGGS